MPSPPSISNWMTLGNPQAGDDDGCGDAIGIDVAAGVRGTRASNNGNDNGIDCELTTNPLLFDEKKPSVSFRSYTSTSHLNDALLEDHLGDCLPNPMDADENDVGECYVESRPLSRQESRRRGRRSAARDTNEPIRDDTGRGHQPLHVENEIAELGTFLSLMQPQDVARAHAFGPTLEEYSVKGVPVDCGENWSRETIEAAIERGPHQSALTPEALELFQEDVVNYQVKAGFCKIVKWDDIKDDLPPQLKISPVAAVPQVGRRPRIILDLSFGVRMGSEIIQQAVNATTATTSHPAALDFLGSSMPRILDFLAHAPSEYPVYLSKYDISDGFWRMVVAAGAEWNFAYVLPQEPGKPIKLVVPSALQMGWKESPGYFCSASETARDVAEEFAGFNGRMHDLPMHKFEKLIRMPASTATGGVSLNNENTLAGDGARNTDNTLADDGAPNADKGLDGAGTLKPGLDGAGTLTAATESASTSDKSPSLRDRVVPWTALEVFVDDFIAMTQDVDRIPHLTRSILQGIEQVFPDPSVTGHVNGKHPLSEKKILNGDADWLFIKEVLGWLIDGEHRTVILPESKASAYTMELRKLLRKKKIPLARFRKIVGKLRFAALCLPAGRALMTPLNMALRGEPRFIGSGKKSEVHESLGDWLKLIESLASRPTSVHELRAKVIDFYGYCDACNTGVGGVWLPLHSPLDAFVWRFKWPKDIAQKLSTYDGLSISEAEGAGVLLQQMVLESEVEDLQHKKALPFCDNTPAVSWVTRMASRQNRIGGRLAKGMAMRARSREMCLPEAFSIEGDKNAMADCASRSFNADSGYLFDDDQLLTHFNANFPLPQNRSWRIVTPRPEDISKVLSTLRGERLTMAQWTSQGERNTGKTGAASPAVGMSLPTLTDAPSNSKQPSLPRLLTGSGKESLDEATRSLLSRLTEQSVPLGRPSSWHVGRTQLRSMAAASESFNSAAFCHPTGEKTHHPSPN